MQRQGKRGGCLDTRSISTGATPYSSGGRQRRCEVPPTPGHLPAAYHFLGQLVHQQLILLALLFHLLGLLVVVDRQLLQGLQHFLHFVLCSIVLGLQVAQLLLHLLIVSPSGHEQLRERGRAFETTRTHAVCVS